VEQLRAIDRPEIIPRIAPRQAVFRGGNRIIQREQKRTIREPVRRVSPEFNNTSLPETHASRPHRTRTDAKPLRSRRRGMGSRSSAWRFPPTSGAADFSCALFDSAGELLAQAAHIPVHLGSMPASVRAVLEKLGTLQEGMWRSSMIRSPAGRICRISPSCRRLSMMESPSLCGESGAPCGRRRRQSGIDDAQPSY